ncbi:catalase family protein [Pseudomonas sp. ZM23]|uniref:Catalase family protein n=1 Tax=Pseudomonas triclosanedens TaxID=2961893 RepID=A0ABY7A804_9PSED|nr:catalase family protein [Pseudomonas triclosanedens]MCP8466314.1 catalase family protein [Pseudomonas triclosanedens]MCP8471840.1 catalase family protein [Pseudomonas triclosanedens]MCP8478535.1 catalase family protein [Pseudomonas triclosanedens]WAI52270.1 catalase family protein [Pseudomonas triclosanedens]
MILQRAHAVLIFLLHVERRFEPFFRPWLNVLLREPMAALIQFFYNLRRPDLHLALAEERREADEEASLQSMIDTMREHLAQDFRPGGVERAGNTKTHGIVRATLRVHDDLPGHLRHGLFAQPASYPCYVRFSGPGPHVEPDIDDVGFLSIGVKVMGVPGPKLMDDERFTQDFTGVCTPTFVTPDTRSNVKLQMWSRRHMGVFYFFDPSGPTGTHLLDLLMQGLWNETQYNPLGHEFYSCVPYLLGEGQAMQYRFRPLSRVPQRIPRLPLRPPDNYLRDNMVRTLAQQDVEFHLLVQVQTDAHRMPLEDAGVRWPDRLSPPVAVATLRIPRQRFDSQAQLDFARNLTINPWHCLPEHRPLGNQNRARKRMYYELARYRQVQNAVQHIEPTGDETFD